MGDAPPRRWRTIWTSDWHLGSRGCQADDLLEFLRANTADTIYLVGDIVDAWAVRHTDGWTPAHDAAIRDVMRRVHDGTRVVYLPGNHDALARAYLGHGFGGVEIVDEATHWTADGRRLWVFHGDRMDPLVRRSRWLVPLAEFGMALARVLHLPKTWRAVRWLLGRPYRTIAAAMAARANTAMVELVDFENSVAREARRRGADGVVCGHTHVPGLRRLEGVLYANDGDWVTSRTALVEDARGRLSLLRWRPRPPVPARRTPRAPRRVRPPAPASVT